MIAGWLPVRLGKELGALLPTWFAAMAAVGGGALFDGGTLAGPALLAFAIGSVVLGAQTVGHEYAHGTLGVLLAQPADRRRLLAVKLAALLLLLVPLTGLAWHLVSLHPGVLRLWSFQPTMIMAMPALAFFVAPALALAGRGVLPGAVFTLVVPPALIVGGDLAGVAIHGAAAAARIDAFRLALFWPGLAAACAAAGVAGWYGFMRVEVLEGQRADLQIFGRRPRDPAEPSRRAGRPLALLVLKELRIQQMTFVVAGLYLLATLALSLMERLTLGATLSAAQVPIFPLTVLYFGVIALLAGALASAEERQLGTLEWQVLLPMASSRQWLVKAGVAIGCALLLGAGLPLLLGGLLPMPAAHSLDGLVHWRQLVLLVLLTSSSLYVSSLSPSGVKALVFSLPAVIALLVLVWNLLEIWLLLPSAVANSVYGMVDAAFRGDSARTYRLLASILAATLGGCLVAVLLRFGMVNHRSADRRLARIAAQVSVIALVAACAALSLIVLAMVLAIAS